MKLGLQIFGMLIIAVLLILLTAMRPGYVTNVTYLSGVLLFELILVSVWHYEKWFFAILMLTFLLAGSSLPLAGRRSPIQLGA